MDHAAVTYLLISFHTGLLSGITLAFLIQTWVKNSLKHGRTSREPLQKRLEDAAYYAGATSQSGPLTSPFLTTPISESTVSTEAEVLPITASSKSVAINTAKKLAT